MTARQFLIETIEPLYPADSKHKDTAALGEMLFKEARVMVGGQATLPTPGSGSTFERFRPEQWRDATKSVLYAYAHKCLEYDYWGTSELKDAINNFKAEYCRLDEADQAELDLEDEENILLRGKIPGVKTSYYKGNLVVHISTPKVFPPYICYRKQKENFLYVGSASSLEEAKEILDEN